MEILALGRRKIIEDDALLGYARAVFMERGAFGTMKNVAQRAGVSEAAIFQRYPTKVALFLAAMMPPDGEAETAIAVEIEDTQAALVETGHRLLKHFRAVIPTAMHLMSHPTIKMSEVADHFGSERVDTIAGHLAAFLKERMAKGQIKATNPLAAAHMLVAAVHSLAVYEMMEIHNADDPEHAVPLFVNALWTGLVPDG
ncbi:MAG: TetR/AcrR family transcriptional regulator [Devosia sp.]